MCIDIDPDSVIHKLIINKLEATMQEWDAYDAEDPDFSNDEGYYSPLFGSSDPEWDTHNLTKLNSFHISLGKPPQTEEEKEVFNSCETYEVCQIDSVPIVGDITLAPICVSKKDGKKSAWIPINPQWLRWIYLWTNEDYDEEYNIYQLNLDQFDSFDHRCDEYPVKHLHISVANLTGKPRDSIARPEDCIIDTITS